MQPYPHTYTAAASGGLTGEVPVTSPGLPEISSAPAPQFDGDGRHWSPETLLTAAVANCFILTFRAVSAAALFGWLKLECRVEGVVDRVERVPQFIGLKTSATLAVARGADTAKARQLLKRADQICLIANSLRGARSLEVQVVEIPAGAVSPEGGSPDG